MRILQWILVFFARICLSVIFILSAGHKLFHWTDAQEGLVQMLSYWQVAMEQNAQIQPLVEQAVTLAPFLLGLAIFLELVGGILVLIGWNSRLGAFFLILFLVPTTILFHQFWHFDGVKKEMEFMLFLKNVAILGGLLYILAHGASITKPKPSLSGNKEES